MNPLNITLASLTLTLAALTAAAQNPYIHVYRTDNKDESSSAASAQAVSSYPLAEVDSICFTPSGSRYNRMVIRRGKASYTIPFSNIKYWEAGPNVATLHITTNPALEEVESKTDYLDGTLNIDGAGVIPDFAGAMQIRGRGNSTWNYPKKAYRIKFAEKTKLWPYKKAKNYVLLANFLDPTLMRNQVAFTAAQLSGMPYPNHAMAVDVWFNNSFRGSYMLTEKCGFNNASVDLTKEDEANSVMFELDTNFDEDRREVSQYFALPVNLKDPDEPLDPTEADAWWRAWLDDFAAMEEAVFYGSDIAAHIDYESLARYLITFNIACNQELNHPKSVYLYKTRGGKYQFGPAWDFDWAFGYQPTYSRVLSGELSEAERRALIDGALAIAKKVGEYGMFEYDGYHMYWLGGESFVAYDFATGHVMPNWPEGRVNIGPSYENYLLGYGKNSNNPNGMGNGGEFFLNIIMDNPDFMEVYAREWENFSKRLPEFWEAFEAYARALKPSFERNTGVWGLDRINPGDAEFADAEQTREGAIDVLRRWLKKRIDFIGRPENNYGLYDPESNFVPHKK